MTSWLDELERVAPDIVAAYRGIDEGRFLSVRREVRRRADPGSARALTNQLASLAEALGELVERLPDATLRRPGGEADWNVAQAVGHSTHARAGLVLAASLAASGRWPVDAPSVTPGIPGPPDAPRDELLRRIGRSQRVVERAAAAIVDHELDPCPLDHPLVGRLRCGEWLLFAGVHDLMHLDQLHRLAGGAAADETG